MFPLEEAEGDLLALAPVDSGVIVVVLPPVVNQQVILHVNALVALFRRLSF